MPRFAPETTRILKNADGLPRAGVQVYAGGCPADLGGDGDE